MQKILKYHILILIKKNSGSTFKQWKKGINLAQGEYIWIAESDDYSESTFLSEMTNILNSRPLKSRLFLKPLYFTQK